LGQSESQGDGFQHTDSYYAVPTEEETVSKEMKVSSPKRYEDIGPIDQESGMPLSFRQVMFHKRQGMQICKHSTRLVYCDLRVW